MTRPAGYSGKPIGQKLGIKRGFRVKTRNAPPNYRELISPLPDDVKLSSRLKAPIDLWHVFSRSREELDRILPQCVEEIRVDGMIWASWPKQSSGVPSDLNGNEIRSLAFPLGLVDIKDCAVDDVWSELKLVIRKSRRR